MLMTSGVNFGFRRTLPHMTGVVLGFPAMVAIIGIGFGGAIIALPWFHDGVSLIGIPYMLWLAWHIASADTSRGLGKSSGARHVSVGGTPEAARPMSFLGATAFQWVNAKAWVMAIGMLSIYAPQGYGVIGGIAIVIAADVLIGLVSAIVWVGFGSVLATWLNEPRRLRVFNITMALLLAATLIPAIIDLVGKYA